VPRGAVLSTSSLGPSLAAAASLEMLPEPLGNDIKRSLRMGFRHGAIIPGGRDAQSVFRHSVAEAVTAIEERDKLLRRFLVDGPYEGDGPIPASKRDSKLSDDECAKAIAFIYSHVVNCFQGRLAELLSVGPCTSLMLDLRKRGVLPSSTRLYAGDAVLVARQAGSGLAKGADLHMLTVSKYGGVLVHGVGEVKSYCRSHGRLVGQLRRHERRAARGLSLSSRRFSRQDIALRGRGSRDVLAVEVVPSAWQLSRNFSFRTVKDRTFLEDEPSLPSRTDELRQLSRNAWRVILRWSQEALAAAAYRLSFWYMGKLGEHIFARGRPSPWPEMTRAEAGRNAATMMLYYAIRRCRTRRAEQRAIALYNSFGFGYPIGMSFRDRSGRRAMLWPEDLREILEHGATKDGSKLWRRRRKRRK